MEREIETKICRITVLEEDVLRIEYKQDCYIDVEDLEENLQAYRKLMKSEKFYLLTIANAGVEPSPEVRDIFASTQRAEFKLAEAFVISSLAQKIIANFVVKVQKPKHLLRFFNSEEEAKEWLFKQKKIIGPIRDLKHNSLLQL